MSKIDKDVPYLKISLCCKCTVSTRSFLRRKGLERKIINEIVSHKETKYAVAKIRKPAVYCTKNNDGQGVCETGGRRKLQCLLDYQVGRWRWWCTDYWETWVIRNIHFIETRAKKQNCKLLFALHVHSLRMKDPDFFIEDFVRALGTKPRCFQPSSSGR